MNLTHTNTLTLNISSGESGKRRDCERAAQANHRNKGFNAAKKTKPSAKNLPVTPAKPKQVTSVYLQYTKNFTRGLS